MVITLLTDFGTSDTYVGQMKGVIAGIAPSASVIDLCHEAPPQNVIAGAVMLADAVDAMPEGAIHVAVIDPGVGSDRAAIAVQTERFTLIGPDNGLLTEAMRRCPVIEAVTLTNPRYQRDTVSYTFHGRDIFSPTAAHLATGTPLANLGDPIEPRAKPIVPEPEREGDTLRGQVLTIDHFGNLLTNLTQAWIEPMISGHKDSSQVSVDGNHVSSWGRTFTDAALGELVAYIGSTGRLEVAQRNGSAAAALGVGPGATVTLALSRGG